MSTPILWILIPLIFSGLGLFLTRYPKLLKWIGTGFGLALAFSAVLLPINEPFRLLFWDIQLSDQFLVFGRRFILSKSDQPIVILLFAVYSFWSLIQNPKHVPSYFSPLSLGGITLILTAYAVDPIFYGALFFAFLALIHVVLLTPPGSEPTQGILRMLIFQILGMLFILFAAWLASWVGFNRGDEVMLSRSLAILALGFSFLLSIFPFISWISMVAEKNHPFLGGYLFNVSFLGIFLFGSRFLTEGGWFARGIDLQAPLQLGAVIMLSFGGLSAVFSRNLGRLTAALVISEIGRSLLAFSLFRLGFPIYFAMVMVQTIALGGWSIALMNLQTGLQDLEIPSAVGSARQWPLLSSGLIVSYFSLAGLPLLAGYPIYLALGNGLIPYRIWINSALVLGSVGLIIGGLRAFSVMIEDSGEEEVLDLGDRFDKGLIIALNLLLLLMGLIPQVGYNVAQLITETLLGP
jgi:formate hydrogenlyase subunit 3/multisubunit Na+/H+ antiporter MnhD subunit